MAEVVENHRPLCGGWNGCCGVRGCCVPSFWPVFTGVLFITAFVRR
jgi:hypothetical protein